MKCMCVMIYKLNLPGRPFDEVFAKIDGYSRYLASNYGLIYDTGLHYIKPVHKSSISNSNKYYDITSVVDDYGNKCNGRINRLVLMAFRPLINYNNFDAHHINENTQDNRLCNLEWKTHLENCQEHYYLKYNIGIDDYLYTDEIIHKICQGLVAEMPYETIANQLLNVPYTEAIRVYISTIRTKRIRKDISDLYPIPKKMRNTAILNDDQIHLVCKYLAKGYKATEIISLIGMNDVDKKRRDSILNVIGKIKNKDRFTRISNLYF